MRGCVHVFAHVCLCVCLAAHMRLCYVCVCTQGGHLAISLGRLCQLAIDVLCATVGHISLLVQLPEKPKSPNPNPKVLGQENRALRILSLNRNRLGPAGVLKFAEALKKMPGVDLMVLQRELGR